MENLVTAVKKSISEAADDDDKLSVWETAVSVYNTLANLLNKHDNRNMLLYSLNVCIMSC